MNKRRRILENSGTRASQSEQENHFFKIILKQILDSGELEIPKEFRRKFLDEVPELVAVLKNPFGRKWQVEVKKVDDSVRFQNGLREFLEYHSVAVGNLLLFRNDGDSIFSVFIFDQSACEIDYPTDDGSGREEPNFHNKCWNLVKKEPKEEDLVEVEPLDISTPPQSLPFSTEEPIDRSQEPQITKGKRPIRRSSRKQTRHRNIQELRELVDGSAPLGSKGKDQLSFGIRNEIEMVEVHSDDHINQKSTSTSSESSSLDEMYMPLDSPMPSSREVVVDKSQEKMRISRRRPETISYSQKQKRNRNNESSNLGVKPSKPSTYGVESSILEGQSGKEISDAEKHLNPSTMKQVNMKRKLDTEEEKAMVESTTKSYDTKNPSFVVTMNEIAVLKSFILFIPKDFAEEHMKRGPQYIKLSVSDGKVWEVNCILYEKKAIFSGGWCKFARDNKLEVGDRCVFELSKVGGVDLNVNIFRFAEEAEPASEDDK